MEKLIFQDESGKDAEFFVLEQTRVSGTDYLLVSDTEDEDGECLILKDTSSAEQAQSLYEIVEDETELDALLTIFGQLLDDVDIEK